MDGHHARAARAEGSPVPAQTSPPSDLSLFLCTLALHPPCSAGRRILWSPDMPPHVSSISLFARPPPLAKPPAVFPVLPTPTVPRPTAHRVSAPHWLFRCIPPVPKPTPCTTSPPSLARLSPPLGHTPPPHQSPHFVRCLHRPARCTPSAIHPSRLPTPLPSHCMSPCRPSCHVPFAPNPSTPESQRWLASTSTPAAPSHPKRPP